MHALSLIVRREMNVFFRTWTGYIIAALTLLLQGLLLNAFAIGNTAKYSAEVLADFFYFSSGITMVAAVFLAIRLIADERSTGSILLFYTSPVSERVYIYAKFFSAFIFLSFIHLLSLYMPLLIMVHGKISVGHLLSGYLALSLLGAATVAIALFCSSLARSQLLAGIFAACLLTILLALWLVAKIVSEPLRELFIYLAIHNLHFSSFRKGIVHSKHIVYYLSVVIFFTETSVRVLQARRWQG